MNYDLLINLLSISSPSGKEEDIVLFIMEYLDKLKVKYTVDEFGNIYNILNQNKPLLSAHVDTVQFQLDNEIFKSIKVFEIIDKKTKSEKRIISSGRTVIGGDDKCGVFIILEMLKNGFKDEINFVFSVSEESGGYGINYFLNNNFDEVKKLPYGLVLDRKGNEDIICTNNFYGVKEFEDILIKIGKDFGYSKATGLFSDANYLSKAISCANLSVGYYQPHSKNEYIVLDDLEKAYDFTSRIVLNVKEKFEVNKLAGNSRYSLYFPYMFDFDNAAVNFDANDFLQEIDDNSNNKRKCTLCSSETGSMTYLYSLSGYICKKCATDLYFELDDFFSFGAFDDVTSDNYPQENDEDLLIPELEKIYY